MRRVLTRLFALPDKLSLLGLVVELARNQPTFQGTQQWYAGKQDHRHRHEHVKPERRFERDFGPDGEKHRRHTTKADDEESGSVRRIREGKIEVTDFTSRRNFQKAVEQMSLPATRASAAYSDPPWFEPWPVLIIVRHDGFPFFCGVGDALP